MPKILLAEDEENLLKAIRLNLEMEGHEVISASEGKTALHLYKNNPVDLIILDVMLPEINGFDICEYIRSTNKDVPILFLTAKSSGNDKITGLKLGADDYITKPFNLEEFLLRVEILLRRSTKKASENKLPEVYKFGDNEINFSTYDIKANNLQQRLSKREIQLLQFLIERKNKVVSRDEILENVWGADVFPTSRTIDNYILAFRKYFEKSSREPNHFHSIRGVGYKFTD